MAARVSRAWLCSRAEAPVQTCAGASQWRRPRRWHLGRQSRRRSGSSGCCRQGDVSGLGCRLSCRLSCRPGGPRCGLGGLEVGLEPFAHELQNFVRPRQRLLRLPRPPAQRRSLRRHGFQGAAESGSLRLDPRQHSSLDGVTSLVTVGGVNPAHDVGQVPDKLRRVRPESLERLVGAGGDALAQEEQGLAEDVSLAHQTADRALEVRGPDLLVGGQVVEELSRRRASLPRAPGCVAVGRRHQLHQFVDPLHGLVPPVGLPLPLPLSLLLLQVLPSPRLCRLVLHTAATLSPVARLLHCQQARSLLALLRLNPQLLPLAPRESEKGALRRLPSVVVALPFPGAGAANRRAGGGDRSGLRLARPRLFCYASPVQIWGICLRLPPGIHLDGRLLQIVGILVILAAVVDVTGAGPGDPSIII
mmetsp:Transcript_24271/g.50760  ORF Transcript_24271/g.50760 Transcript_24271/m.50760 type:complete len:418 (-) Transcript_24271:237-1490(-)